MEFAWGEQFCPSFCRWLAQQIDIKQGWKLKVHHIQFSCKKHVKTQLHGHQLCMRFQVFSKAQSCFPFESRIGAERIGRQNCQHHSVHLAIFWKDVLFNLHVNMERMERKGFFFKETHRLPLLQEVAWVMISSLSNTRLLSSMGWWFFPSNGSQIPYSDGGRRFEQVGLTISVVLLGPSFYQEGWIEVRSRIKLPKSTPLCCKMCLRMHLLSKKTPLDESHRNL